MRDGIVVRTSQAKDETKASLVAAMLGRADAEVSYPDKSAPPVRSGAPLLKVEKLSAASGVDEIDLEVHAGEIVGLIGLVGSGRTEIARAIFGADPVLSGHVLIDGQPYDDRSPERSVERRIAMVPEDRRKQGLVLTQTVRPNMTLPHLPAFSSWGLLRGGDETNAVRRFVDYLGVSPREVDGHVVNYSGGNQQKVLLGKWIMRDPRLVILDEPSRGVDLGARRRIHEFISDLAKRGTGVLLISSEMEEVLGLAHRAYLVRSGRIIDEIVPGEASPEQVLWKLFHSEDGTIGQRRAS
jgi:ribose transport system ATP-binding protein